ncbi:sacsin N-terminal ATP-binding-like domain-containing protein [Paenibacillus amylolyticus]|uniref:sacsin N-terminal ATP-binding-like domain-containing protein n=1 Tax=Paenibacillus amylolyticus TaxID=1451 RepID=UPI00201DBC27|nr:hypothetical protein [Paenibacillus amylolyticus]MCL6659681.1 hypothetical protein [Paenibacillus amylolyticus]
MSVNIEIHNKLMEEGYIEAAASKINLKLSELRESGNDRLCRRWIWELIQNANDCANPAVDIKVEQNNDYLTFSHSGKPFDYKSLMSLVTQISTKESSLEDTTGKFGTGFTTTHLLSEKVKIQGLFVDELDKKVNLNFLLDRSGKDIHEIKEQVIESLEQLKDIGGRSIDCDEKIDNQFNTSFIYNLKDANKNALNEGKLDFDKTVYYVLVFVKTINEIRYNEVVYRKNQAEKTINSHLKIIEVSKEINNIKTIKKFLIGYNEGVEIAVEINEVGDEIVIVPFEINMPKLFCKFPLVGTENYFPVAVNSANFRVEAERDGIYESSPTNKGLMMQAVKLYEEMLKYVAEQKYKFIYNMCFLNNMGTSELQKDFIKQVKEICKYAPIVYTNVGSFSSLYNKNSGDPILLIPNCDDKNVGLEFWDLLNFMKNMKPMPEKQTCQNWAKALQSNCSIENLCDWISGLETVEKMMKHFDTKENMFQGLSKLYQIIYKYRDGEGVKKHKIFLNQEGKVTNKIQDLYIDYEIDQTLIDILEELGTKIRRTLLSKNIKLPEMSRDFEIEKLTNEDIAHKICEKVRKILVEETQGKKREEETQKIFDKITLWFLKNHDEAKKLFLDIYENKYNLSTKKDIIDKFEFAVEAKETLEIYKIPSLEELKKRLDIHNSDLEIYYSQYKLDDLLVGLAIDNLEELDKNNNIESVKCLLKHSPRPSPEALKSIEEKIERSKRNVLNHLNSFPEIYKVNEKRELARTVYGDIYKNGQKIKVVIRPSDSDMIILFYQSELDVLDDNNYELWIDDGKKAPRQLTFGDILITTGIRVIPLKNLF